MTSQEEILFNTIAELDIDQVRQELYQAKLQQLNSTTPATAQYQPRVDKSLVKVLQSKLKPYKGNRNVQEIRTYLLRLEEYFQAAADLSPEGQLLVATTYLELHAEVWWQSHVKC
ncbi:uncharacterized protein SPPG_09325 [Spizellomyces punctatus DAOM BR117]|uniref:DUF4939 domain-containing protein n=1 Tax=Spizellomyces punctatus (strain DAOM BR117) TaxID=645134 RepID=A0A0L0HD93_SPIPD|nr:uncharacterized protein SPPG_09325 [Spizellomyces punctatus DAOM BR117]KNC98944.1 hypothetical protein SPPG_09325 [Spizellomyces punctatus DAOM BR117]|eukprot:XP_016606984.1 hypothetical protein SPPG_09325 [Spizellomyces punctatus DAOM BR117]